MIKVIITVKCVHLENVSFLFTEKNISEVYKLYTVYNKYIINTIEHYTYFFECHFILNLQSLNN